MVLLRLKRGTLRILLHVMMMLTKLLWSLKSNVFLTNVGLTEVREDVSEDTLCNKWKKTRFKHLIKGSKRMDMISVTSVINRSKY